MNLSAVSEDTTTHSPDDGTWGTATYFSRLTGADLETASYWLRTVSRPAHRFGHPHLNIDGCPGCAFERAVA
jgi:hypothetical protein